MILGYNYVCVRRTWVGVAYGYYLVKSSCKDQILGYDALILNDVFVILILVAWYVE